MSDATKWTAVAEFGFLQGVEFDASMGFDPDDVPDFSAIGKVLNAHDALVAALEAVEWAETDMAQCISNCGGHNPSKCLKDIPEGCVIPNDHGHRDDCQLDAALREANGGTR